jgi:hypothetical protein
MIDTPVDPGDGTIDGGGSPNCNLIDICQVGGQVGGHGATPSNPPCTFPDSIIGSGPTDPMGHFHIVINPPLGDNECIYAYDTCSMLISPVVCIRPAAPVPALSPRLLAVALGILSLIAFVGMIRLRRRSESP